MSFRSIILAAILLATHAAPVHTQVVISQIFGGGGNTGAAYTHDFVELFNRSDASVNLAGWSLQFGSPASSTSLGATASTLTELSGFLLPGQYLLVRGVTSGTTGVALPSPDIIDPSPPSIAAASGKVALARTTATLGSPCPTAASFKPLVADFVGFGTSNCWEGAAAAPLAGNTRAVVRAVGGCTDTDNNAGDFVATAPAPRTRASALSICVSAAPPPAAVVPEPRSILLLATGTALIGLAGGPRRRLLSIRRIPAPR